MANPVGNQLSTPVLSMVTTVVAVMLLVLVTVVLRWESASSSREDGMCSITGSRTICAVRHHPVQAFVDAMKLHLSIIKRLSCLKFSPYQAGLPGGPQAACSGLQSLYSAVPTSLLQVISMEALLRLLTSIYLASGTFLLF